MSPLPLTDSIRRVLERVGSQKPLVTECYRCGKRYDGVLPGACPDCGSTRLWVLDRERDREASPPARA